MTQIQSQHPTVPNEQRETATESPASDVAAEALLDFGQLQSLHAQIEARLRQLDSLRSLTLGEQEEYVTLKKNKLWAKSRMVLLSAQN